MSVEATTYWSHVWCIDGSPGVFAHCAAQRALCSVAGPPITIASGIPTYLLADRLPSHHVQCMALLNGMHVFGKAWKDILKHGDYKSDLRDRSNVSCPFRLKEAVRC